MASSRPTRRSSTNSCRCLLCSKVNRGKNHVVEKVGDKLALNGKNGERYYIDVSIAKKTVDDSKVKHESRICHRCYTAQLKVWTRTETQ